MKRPIDLITVDEVAAMLNLKKRSVRKMIEDRRLPHYKLGHRTIRFDQGEIFDILKKSKITAK